jgi:hypothetical protein
MSKQNAVPVRRRRRWWLIPVVIVAAIAVVVAGVTVAHFASPGTTTADPAGAATDVPTGTGSTAPVQGVDYALGCVAGPSIDTKDLLELREKKQFTPAGAAEFLGAFMQVYSAADPDRRPDLRSTVDDVTSGTAHSMLAASDLSKPGYDDGQTHGVDLSGSAYLIRDSTDTTVKIAFAGLTTTNGKPDHLEGSTTQYQYTGGTFTLTTSAQGWVISGADPSPGWDEGLTSGNKYKEGC